MRRFLMGFAVLLNFQEIHSIHYLVQNLKDNSGHEGVVIASPSRENPNYYYHWVRDAGLVIRELIAQYNRLPFGKSKNEYANFISSWVEVEKQNQTIAAGSWADLGEPIFTVQGGIYPNPWGRPQNDGPAIRALAMLEWADVLFLKGEQSKIGNLYTAELPAKSPIKKDLEYIAHHWNEPSFDLWEEVKGLHFFNLMAQRLALKKGAELAAKLSDYAAADFYNKQVNLIKLELERFYDPSREYIIPTVDQVDGWTHKTSMLDISIVLAINYFSFEPLSQKQKSFLQNTVSKLEEDFAKKYLINSANPGKPVLFGRYPEDVYDGNGFSGGNPWYLATHAIAESYCRKLITSKSGNYGSQYLSRSAEYASPEGHFSEQVDRNSGQLRGARDLTWSYSSFLRAARYCQSSERIKK